jgi:hypothetical protein
MGTATRWLASFFEDSALPGHASAKRLVFIAGGFALSLSTVILSIAACAGAEVSASLLAVTGPLAGMAGYGYVNGKKVEKTTGDGV